MRRSATSGFCGGLHNGGSILGKSSPWLGTRMDKKSFTVIAVLVTNITLSCTLTAAQQNTAPPSAAGQNQPSSSQPTKTPERADAAKNPRAASGGEGNRPGDNQQSSQPSITLLVPEKSAQQLDEERKDREREIAIEERIGRFTGYLVGVGLLQFLAIAMGFIWTRRAANAATTSANAARESIVMTHRPKIIVREIDIPETIPLFKLQDTSAITTLTGSFRITNKGNTAATVGLMEATIYVGRLPPPPHNPCFGKTLSNAFPRLPPGTTTRIDFEPHPVTSGDFGDIRAGKVAIYALGKIIYTDELGNARRTGFARRFDMNNGRFTITKDDPDYEYVD